MYIKLLNFSNFNLKEISWFLTEIIGNDKPIWRLKKNFKGIYNDKLSFSDLLNVYALEFLLKNLL